MVIVLLLTSAIAFAQDSLSIHLRCEIANLADNPRIQIDGSLVVVTAESGLIVCDLSDPENPVSRNILTRLDPRSSYSPPFAFAGSLLVVAYHQFITAYRVESVDRVIPLGSINFNEHWCSALATDGRFIYARVQTLGIVVIDAADPANLRENGRLETGQYCRDMLINNDILVTYGMDTTCVIDVTNPAEPTLVSILPPVYDFAFHDNSAYLLTRDSLNIYDLTTPDDPELHATIASLGREYGYSQAISVNESRVVIAYDGGRVRQFELDNEFNLSQEGEFRTPCRWPRDCMIWGDYLLSAGGVWGGVVSVIDASDPANMSEAAEIGMIEDGYSSFMIGDYLICPSDTAIWTKYRFEDDRFQRVHRGVQDWDEVGGFFHGGVVIGQAIYDAFYGIRIWDCSDPLNIRFGATAAWPENREIQRFEGNESFALVGWRDSTMEVLSTEDIFDPHSVGQVNFGGLITGLGLGDSVAFAAVRSDSLRVVSVSLRPENWLEIGNSVTVSDGRGYCWSLPVFGDLLYAIPDYHVRVIDVSDPMNLVLAGQIDSTFSVAGFDRYVACAHYEGGFRIYDVSNPAQPVERAHFEDDRRASFKDYNDGRLLASYRSGLALFDIEGLPNSIENEPVQVPDNAEFSAFPNPFNSTLTISFGFPPLLAGGELKGGVRLAIYDVNGREVADLSSAVTAPSVTGGNKDAVTNRGMTAEQTVIWNASNQPAGVFFIRMDSGSKLLTRKVLLIR